MTSAASALHVDICIVGAGPAGSAAAARAAHAGFTVALIDAQEFPRDKTCGDGLTTRAVTELDRLYHDLGRTPLDFHRTLGLQLAGFGGTARCPQPGGALRRTLLDDALRNLSAASEGVVQLLGTPASHPIITARGIEQLSVGQTTIHPRFVIVADGVRSTFGKQLGRVWHKELVFGLAARGYSATPHSSSEWIHSDLEMRDAQGNALPGYGWIFPLGDGTVNIGAGVLTTANRPAKVNTKQLLQHYVTTKDDWHLSAPESVASAALPMGGAVTGVAGPNWMLIGDAAACVNPLNGEGIDYGLETARLAIELLRTTPTKDFTLVWPDLLRQHFGPAFTLARTFGLLITHPKLMALGGTLAMRTGLMPTFARLMGNTITDEDHDFAAQLWRTAGRAAERLRGDRPLWG